MLVRGVKGDNILALVARRLREQISNFNFPVDEWASVIAKQSPGIKWANLKTLLGSWTTSARLHESFVRPCVFGCAAEDKWSHYLECIPLWRACLECNMIEYIRDPAERMQHCMTTDDGVLAIATAFSLYHHVKNDMRNRLYTLTFERTLEIALAARTALL